MLNKKLHKKELSNRYIYVFLKKNLKLFLISIISGVFVAYFLSIQPKKYNASMLLVLCQTGENTCITPIRKIALDNFYPEKTYEQCGLDKNNDDLIFSKLNLEIVPEGENIFVSVKIKSEEKELVDSCFNEIIKNLSVEDAKISNYLTSKKDYIKYLESNLELRSTLQGRGASESYLLDELNNTKKLIALTRQTELISPITYISSPNLTFVKKHTLYTGILLGFIISLFIIMIKYFVFVEQKSNSK